MNKSSKALTIILILLIAALCVSLAIWALKGSPKSKEAIPTPVPVEVTPEPVVTPVVFNTKTEVSAETVEDGLRDMGFLITQEYYFTDLVSCSKSVTIKNTELLKNITESSFTGSYDGVITAGIDFGGIKVSKAGKMILVDVPKAVIKNVDIDPDSFSLYSEKTNLFTNIQAEDYNASMVELEASATEKAISKGVLEKANENAETIILNFIMCFEDLQEYTVDIRFV